MAQQSHGARARTEQSRAPVRQRARRTQEERSAETRARVVAAATECVAELGFRGATMSAIAQRAGVSWGAMQHHYGDKDSILDAVLEHSLSGFEQALMGLGDAEPDPARRVRALMARCRELLRGPRYRAFLEIQLGRGRTRREADEAWSAYAARTLERIWKDLFGDLALPRRQLQAAQRFAFMVLSGIAAESILFPGADFTATHLEILEETLMRRLGLES